MWALVKEVRLESLKAKTIMDEHIIANEERFESAEMLEILGPVSVLGKEIQYQVRYIRVKIIFCALS